jgi:enolase
MPHVFQLKANWILDSRGLPTVACVLTLDHNGRKVTAKASVPSGASTGSYEALELRDGQKAFHGKGVDQAVANINGLIFESLNHKEFANALELDQFLLNLDHSANKSQLGANAILAVSMAAHRAFANLAGLELWQYLRRLYFSSLPAVYKFPRLMCNVLNGGKHADNGISIQEFMIVPNQGNLLKDVQAASEIYHSLKKLLQAHGKSTALGDEGGFAPDVNDSSGGQNGENYFQDQTKLPTELVLDYLLEAITNSNYSTVDCQLALDAAANEFFVLEKKSYLLDNREFNQTTLTEFYAQLVEKYPLISIEDGFSEDDILGWQVLTEMLGQKIHLIGDDIFVTNPRRFEEVGLRNHVANGVLIKLNQIGSVSETCAMINQAKENQYITVVSHRSGETTDDFMADLAFAAQSEFIKLGAPARGERVAKYNRLIEIYHSLTH